jgi:uncharacterized protein (DUF983 family)
LLVAIVLLIRALLLRCPACGSAGLFTSWFAMRTACPGCGLVMEREEGYFLGAMMFNLVFSELLFVALLTGVVLWTWPDPPWDALWIGGVLGMVLFPLLFYPLSKTLWLAFDLLFRPAARRDFQEHHSELSRPNR